MTGPQRVTISLSDLEDALARLDIYKPGLSYAETAEAIMGYDAKPEPERGWHWERRNEATLAGTMSPIWSRIDNETGRSVYEDGTERP